MVNTAMAEHTIAQNGPDGGTPRRENRGFLRARTVEVLGGFASEHGCLRSGKMRRRTPILYDTREPSPKQGLTEV